MHINCAIKFKCGFIWPNNWVLKIFPFVTLMRNHSQNCSRLSGSSSFSACISLGIQCSHIWARKIRWTLDISSPISREHCLNDFFGDRAKTCVTASTLSLSVEFLFLPHRSFNTSCTVHSTLKLSQILVIVTLVGGGGVPNSALQRRWTSANFSTFQYYFSNHLRSSNDNFIAMFV